MSCWHNARNYRRKAQPWTTASRRLEELSTKRSRTTSKHIKRLEEAGDALANTQTYDLLETVNWRKSKEAKP